MRRIFVAVVFVLLIAGIVWFVSRDTDGPVARLAGSSSNDEKKAVEAARGFLSEFVDPDGRVVRRDQGSDTVSEGQGYAMLLAVAANDEERFRRVWDWTRQNLQRPDGLFSWLWKSGSVADKQAASDADIDIAAALFLGAERFEDPSLSQEGSRVADSILDLETVKGQGGMLLVAGPWATESSPYVANPSYFAPSYFELLAKRTGDERWKEVVNASRYVLGKLSEKQPRLPPDWVKVSDSGEVVPAGSADGGGEPKYGWDAVRVPIRMADDCDDFGRQYASSLWAFLKTQKEKVAATYSLEGHPKDDYESPVGLAAAAAAAHAAGDGRAMKELLERADKNNQQHRTYYGEAWAALTRVMLTTDLLGAC